MVKDSNQDNAACQTLPPALYLVATPIGNLGDITLRALEVLKAADMIACEDTRVTGKLLSHYGISTTMVAYHEHNASEMRPRLLHELQSGKAVALVSDAGTPLISDPGYKLVKEVAEQGDKVIPIPGASSVTAALCAGGLPTNRFLFVGFLPTKEIMRKKTLIELRDVPATLVLFESARRLPEVLAALAESFGEREAVVARELTKLYEEFRRGTLSDIAAYYARHGEPKGEVVILIAPPEEKQAVYDASVEEALAAALSEFSVKDAAAKIAKERGLPRQELYTHALALKAKK